MEKALRFSAIVYNHDAFYLLLGRKVLHKVKVITDWDLDKWYIKPSEKQKCKYLLILIQIMISEE